jgi:hypothetical protein
MTQRQYNVHSQQRRTGQWQRRHPLLQRHPVLVPCILIGGSLLFALVSYYADSLFPIFAYLGASPVMPCLLLACVSGTCGLLTGIIAIIEHVDQPRAFAVVSPEIKEPRYDRN